MIGGSSAQYYAARGERVKSRAQTVMFTVRVGG
jgi:hypothetical protein